MATIVRPLWLAAEWALFSCNDRALWNFSRLFWVASKKQRARGRKIKKKRWSKGGTTIFSITERKATIQKHFSMSDEESHVARKRTWKITHHDKRVGKRVTRFAKIVGFLRGLPSLCSQEEALKFTLELITSQRSRNTLQLVIELSLQEYKIKESNLLHYFKEGLIHSSLRTLHGKQEIEEWDFCPIFRAGTFSIESINSLTSGRNLLEIQIESFEEISSNCCSLDVRKFVYGILSDVGMDDGKHET